MQSVFKAHNLDRIPPQIRACSVCGLPPRLTKTDKIILLHNSRQIHRCKSRNSIKIATYFLFLSIYTYDCLLCGYLESVGKMGDEPVMATNDDASECKRGAVQLGYWQDNYIPHFVKHIEKRAPEIHRGYYARVKGVESFVKRFLQKTSTTPSCCPQIVNFGAGFDTLYWRLKDENYTVHSYVEIDFPSVTARKCYAIKRCKELLEKIHEKDGEVKLSSTDLHAGNYHCIGVDIRNITQLANKLQQAEINFNNPTLFIAECVLVYIEDDCVNRLLTWIASKFKSALFINYEMCNMNDTFGDVMLGNLRVRGCNLAGISFCKSLDTQKNRFLNNNWQGAKIWDMVQIYYALSVAERERIEKIEFLDERELLIQLFQHYCICIGWLGTEFADINCNDEG